MEIEVKELFYAVPGKMLLQGVNATFPRGVVNVLMGHSGAGKTTLMDLIARRKVDGTVAGCILYDQSPRLHRKDIAYIQTFDVHLAEFTVLQTLFFHAQLRLGQMSSDSYLKQCRIAAKTVNLESALDTVVGSNMVKGISGGQKKRLSIAVELLAVPAVLCLDEPTSGLDSSTSLQVAECLSNLAVKSGKTIICTVHSPSIDMLNLWHNLYLMSSGNLVYCGPIDQVSSVLSGLGHRIPMEPFNPVEFALDLIADDKNAADLTSAWKSSRMRHPALRTTEDVSETSAKSDGQESDMTQEVNTREDVSVARQTRILIHRHALYTFKCVHGLTAMILRNVGAGLAFGLLYYDNGDKMVENGSLLDSETLLYTDYCMNMQALQFLIVTFVIIINVIAVPSMFELSRLYRREQAANLYSPFAYWISLFVVDVLSLLLGTVIFAVCMQYLVGLHGPNYKYYVVTLLASIAGYVQAKLCAWSCSDGISGFVFFAVVGCIEIVLSGFVVVKDSVPQFMRWTMDITFSKWATGALMFNEFNDLLPIGPYARIYDTYTTQGQIVLAYFGYNNFDISKSIFILIVFIVAMEILVVYMIHPPRSKVKYVKDRSDMASVDEEEVDEEAHRGTSFSMAVSLKEDLLSDDGTVFSHNRTRRRRLRDSLQTVSSYTPSIITPYSRVLGQTSINVKSISHIEPSDIFRISAVNMIDAEDQAKLIFKDVRYVVENKGEEKALLKSASGVALPGELCAVMGSSGAGKTTLLNVLAGQASIGTVSGSILVNNTSLAAFKEKNGISRPPWAYIMQTDSHFPTLTVKETLQYAAMLRMKESSPSSDAVSTAVMATMDLLGLNHIADSYIGSGDELNISCGQIRRLSIAVEIIHKPTLIFADEPTSGLDSFLVSAVVDGLVNLAKSNATVMCTIHQPSPEVFKKFHKVLLMCDGHVIYFGPVNSCVAHFESLGFYCIQGNAAEFIVKVASDVSGGDKSDTDSTSLQLTDCVEKSDVEIRKLLDAVATVEFQPSLDNIDSPERQCCDYIKFTLITMVVLLKRDALNIARRPFWFSSTTRSLGLGIFIGLLWMNADQFQEFLGFYFVAYFLTNLWLLEIVPGLHENKAIFNRERNAGATTNMASCLVMGIPVCLLAFVLCLLFLVPSLYLQEATEGSFDKFFKYFSILYLGTVSNVMLNHVVAECTPNPMMHTLVFPGLVIPLQSIFSGFSVLISTMPLWMRWGVNVDIMRWVLNALFQIDLKHNDEALGIYTFEDLEELYGWKSSIRDCFLFVIGNIFVYKVLTFVCMKYVSFFKA